MAHQASAAPASPMAALAGYTSVRPPTCATSPAMIAPPIVPIANVVLVKRAWAVARSEDGTRVGR